MDCLIGITGCSKFTEYIIDNNWLQKCESWPWVRFNELFPTLLVFLVALNIFITWIYIALDDKKIPFNMFQYKHDIA